MGFFSRFENKMEDAVEGTAEKLARSPISPVQISKQCEKHMLRNKMVGAGKQYAPTLYTVLVNAEDDAHLFSFYPTLAGEIETTIRAKAGQAGLFMDGQPLVRFIVDDKLKHGKFDVIAEVVSAGIVAQLRAEEMERYGLKPSAQQARPQQAPQRQQQPQQFTQAPAGYGSKAAALVENQADYYDDGYQSEVIANDPFGGARYNGGEQDGGFDPFAPQTSPAGGPYGEALDEPSFNAPVVDPFTPAGEVAAAGAAVGAAGAVAASAEQNAPQPQQQSPQPQQRAQAQSLLVDNVNGHTYVLSMSGMVAGRSKDCSIVVPDINASRQHARFIQDASGRWSVTDLGSKNGTLVNGGFIKETTPLYDGDIITLGLTTYVYTVR